MLEIFKVLAEIEKSKALSKPARDDSRPGSESKQVKNDCSPTAYHLRGDRLSYRAILDSAVDDAITQLLRSWWRHIDNERSRERNVTGPVHLVSLVRPIHLLARRAIAINERVPIDEPALSPFSLIHQYHGALDVLCHRVQTAMEAGQITPRDDLVGTRVMFPPGPEFKFWLALCRAVRRCEKTVVTEMLTEPLDRSVDEIFPCVLVDPAEFSKWAESECITSVGEVERLLNGSSIRGVRSDAPSLTATASTSERGIEWQSKAKQYADEIYRHDRAVGCNPSKYDVAKDVAKRFEAENVHGPRGGLSAETILRHALHHWQKPPT